jgi:hypothetical protein
LASDSRLVPTHFYLERDRRRRLFSGLACVLSS